MTVKRVLLTPGLERIFRAEFESDYASFKIAPDYGVVRSGHDKNSKLRKAGWILLEKDLVMHSTKFKSFAIVGSGSIGTPIIDAFLALDNISLVVLTRSGSTKPIPMGAKSVIIDYDDPETLVKAFKEHDVEVVVSTLSLFAIIVQVKIADAAKKAGVKLFVPSEFGFPTHGYAEGIVAPKGQVIEHCLALGLPYTKFYTGFFIGWVKWALDYKESEGKAYIIGKGDTKASFTAERDIAGFVAYVLSNLPLDRLANKTFRIQGDRLTLREIARVVDPNIKIEHVQSFDDPMGEARKGLQDLIEQGRGSNGWDEPSKSELTGDEAAGSSNRLWEGHKWTTAKDFFETEVRS